MFIRLIFVLLLPCFVQAQVAEEGVDQALSDSIVFKGLGLVASPIVPPAFLLFKPAEIPNKTNVRKRDYDLSAQIVSANGVTSIGLSLEYNLTKDLNYWLAKYNQYNYQTQSEVDVKVQRFGFEYRMFPYRRIQLGAAIGASKITYDKDSETSIDLQFPLKWILNKYLAYYYMPTYSYWTKESEISHEISTGINMSLQKFLRLNAGLIYIKGRNGVEDETLTSLDFVLAL